MLGLLIEGDGTVGDAGFLLCHGRSIQLSAHSRAIRLALYCCWAADRIDRSIYGAFARLKK